MVGVLVSISVSCGVDSGNLSSIPCTIAVVVMMKITSSTQARSSNGVMLISETALWPFLENRLIAYSPSVLQPAERLPPSVPGRLNGGFRFLTVRTGPIVLDILAGRRGAVLGLKEVGHEHRLDMGGKVIQFHREGFRLGHQKVVAKERGDRDHETCD